MTLQNPTEEWRRWGCLGSLVTRQGDGMIHVRREFALGVVSVATSALMLLMHEKGGAEGEVGPLPA